MTQPAYRVEPAQFPADAADVVSLFRQYADSLPFSLEYQGFSDELAGLPGAYAQPRGIVLLARSIGARDALAVGRRALGVVALRPLPLRAGELEPPGGLCEMKRLFVDPGARGMGIGKALVGALIDHARHQKYATMRLDTSHDMHAAHAVYRSFGFIGACRYNNDPDPCTMYFELNLRG